MCFCCTVKHSVIWMKIIHRRSSWVKCVRAALKLRSSFFFFFSIGDVHRKFDHSQFENLKTRAVPELCKLVCVVWILRASRYSFGRVFTGRPDVLFEWTCDANCDAARPKERCVFCTLFLKTVDVNTQASIFGIRQMQDLRQEHSVTARSSEVCSRTPNVMH